MKKIETITRGKLAGYNIRQYNDGKYALFSGVYIAIYKGFNTIEQCKRFARKVL